MSWKIEISNCIKKEICKIPDKDLMWIFGVIESMKTDPFVGDRQKLKGGENEYRRRIGDWRLFFYMDVYNQIIFITHIRRKSDNTYNKK